MHLTLTSQRPRAQRSSAHAILPLIALLLSVLPFSVCVSTAAPVERWDFQIQRPAAHDIDIWRGETIDFTPRFLSYSVPWRFTTGATVTLYWSTNRWATAPWATNGVVMSDTGRVSVTWSPDCDAGANSYNYFIGVSETNGLLCRVTGVIKMHGSPSFAPSTAPLPVWDGWTNNYTYATYAALLSTSNALAAGQQSTSNALALALQTEATRAQQAEASAVATAQAALAAGLTGASNYTDRATAASVAAGLATGTAARALSAALLDQSDSQAWVTVAAGTATLWRVETSTNYIQYLRCGNAGSSIANGLYYLDTVLPNCWLKIGSAEQQKVLRLGSGPWLVISAGTTLYSAGGGQTDVTTATWTENAGSWPLPVFSFTNIYTSITNRYPLAGSAEVAAASNLAFQASAAAAVAATNSVDPVARASAASKPSYTDATNIASAIVSAYAAPSFPVYDYGLRTNVVFVLSNSVLYLYER